MDDYSSFIIWTRLYQTSQLYAFDIPFQLCAQVQRHVQPPAFPRRSICPHSTTPDAFSSMGCITLAEVSP